MNYIKFREVLLVVFLAFVTGCASTGGGGGNYTVGPGSKEKVNPTKSSSSKALLSAVVPIFDPGIPENKADYEKKAIWPEVRRTEAVRFSHSLATKMEATSQFDGVRVTPDANATASLYVMGEIKESNGLELKLDIKVLDINGKNRFTRNYSFKVEEYSLNDPRISRTTDLYEPFMEKIAKDIASAIKKIRAKDADTLVKIEQLRFAEFFQPDYAAQYMQTNKRGKARLVSFPAEDDLMLERFKLLKVNDQMFIDSIQSDYNAFSLESNEPYTVWQRAAFVETKAAKEAASKAAAKQILGALILVAGAAMAADAGYYDSTTATAGMAVALGGAAAIASGMGDSKQAKLHKESLNELGKSLNIEIAPKVMKLEDREVELEGTVAEQYQSWRSALKRFYVLERTPEIEL